MLVTMDYPTSISGRQVSAGETVEVSESDYTAIRLICHPARAEPVIYQSDTVMKPKKKGGRHGV